MTTVYILRLLKYVFCWLDCVCVTFKDMDYNKFNYCTCIVASFKTLGWKLHISNVCKDNIKSLFVDLNKYFSFS
jgi:hypothetical protein